MKATYHIPTEQFGFVELEGEVETMEEAITEYNALKMGKTASVEGIDPPVWNKLLDGYFKHLETGFLEAVMWESMNPQQQWFFQEIKKLKKRKNYNG